MLHASFLKPWLISIILSAFLYLDCASLLSTMLPTFTKNVPKLGCKVFRFEGCRYSSKQGNPIIGVKHGKFVGKFIKSMNRNDKAQDIMVSPRSRMNYQHSCVDSGRASDSSRKEMKDSSANDNVQGISIKSRFPTGSLRDTRFGEVESGEMEITFLGTASCIPTVTRGVSAVAMRYNRDVWLFDCGESTQRQLQNSRIRASRIKKIFLSHTHGDHCFGLPGVLCMLGQSTMDEREKSHLDGEEPVVVDIYGPEGVRDFVRAAMQLTYSRVTAPYRVHELKNVPMLHGRGCGKSPTIPHFDSKFDSQFGEREGGNDIYPNSKGIYDLTEENNLTVAAAPMQHTVPCVGFVVTENNRPGSLRIDKVSKLVHQNKLALQALPENEGNYMKTFRILKDLGHGESFVFPDGVAVRGEDINEPIRPGRKIVIMGDTCSGRMIKDMATRADVLIHEATNSYFSDADNLKYKSYSQVERESFHHGHSTPQMAGRFAAEIEAKQLILTHFSPRYLGDASETSMKIMWNIEDMARSTSKLLRPNDVIAAWDYMSVSVPLPHSIV